MSRSGWASVLLMCAAGCTTGGTLPQLAVAPDQPPLDAMLLPPVDNQLTFWANTSAYYALLGVAPDSSVHVLYWQSPSSWLDDDYTYVSKSDASYARVYLLASSAPLDLSEVNRPGGSYALGRAISSAEIAEGYVRHTETTGDMDFWTGADSIHGMHVMVTRKSRLRFFVLAHPNPEKMRPKIRLQERSIRTIASREIAKPTPRYPHWGATDVGSPGYSGPYDYYGPAGYSNPSSTYGPPGYSSSSGPSQPGMGSTPTGGGPAPAPPGGPSTHHP